MKIFTRIGALALSAAMVFGVGGCNLVKVDEEKDMSQIVAKIGETEVTKEEYTNAVEQRIRQLEQYGQAASGEDVSGEVLENIISSEVMIQKAKELGKYDASEERKKEVEDYYDEMINYYLEGGGLTEQATAELGEGADEVAIKAKALEALKKQLEEEGGSLEELHEQVEDYMATVWLQEDFFKEIKISDDEIKTWYDGLVEEQKTAITEDPASVSYYTTHAYMPEGYKYVRHVLIKLDAEKTAKLQELTVKQDGIAAEIGKLMVDDEKANNVKISELRNENNEIKTETDGLKSELEAKANEILLKAQSGEDFEALITEFGEDEGMKDPILKGYLVGKENSGYVETFFEAATILGVGEISKVVEGYAPDNYFGYHIIKNIEDVKEGPVPLEEITTASEEALEAKKQDEWVKQIDTWVEEAAPERFLDAMKDNSAEFTAE